jgi:ribonuclease-3
MNGNAFEALVGAIYLDRGYDACMRFMEKRILAQLINIDKVAYKEVNFKSKLLEWSQKNRVKLEFREMNQTKDAQTGSPVFTTQVFLEGVEGCKGTGFSKKESHQQASKETLQRLRREPQFIDAIFAAKADRTKMEEEPVMVPPDIDKLQQENEQFIIEQEKPVEPVIQPEGRSVARNAAPQRQTKQEDEFTLDDITATPREKTREEIIAEAEAAAFAEE